MQVPVFLVDAFTERQFAGNQAAVCLVPQKLTDVEYQKVAAEFNLSETAFPLPEHGHSFRTASRFNLRWFTPKVEVSLCGHATLATAHTLFYELGNQSASITFETKSGELVVRRKDGRVAMDMPAYQSMSIKFKHFENPFTHLFSEFQSPPYLMDLIKCLIPESISINCVQYSVDTKKLLVVVDGATTRFELDSLLAGQSEMVRIHDGSFVRGVAVTLAPVNPKLQGFVSEEEEPYDYVCRYFAPWVGINEDPATGSAQCVLAPFWSKVLEKDSLFAFQNYPNRGAQFRVEMMEGRIMLLGSAVTVVKGELTLKTMTFYEPKE